ncbi:MAG: DUF3179 domain-containing (seleno)protein [Pseudomonadota bacterium]
MRSAPATRLPQALLIAAMALATTISTPTPTAAESRVLPEHVLERFGQPPATPDGPLSAEMRDAIQTVFIEGLSKSLWNEDRAAALERIAASGDPRVVWLISDMMRFTWQPSFDNALVDAGERLLKIEIRTPRRWSEITNHLIAWDIPAYPGYLEHKRAIFRNFLPGLEEIFVEGAVDWRHVSWGGVLIDDRAYDTTDEPCNCIPAADNPEVSSAAEATWLRDDDVVFGVEVGGEFRAYPRQIMEVREMVNDTLGGRDLGIPYCTLCGAAQAYFTDRLPEGVERPVLRTSGLLSRSNKLMYDITTQSVFDTFLGTALTGPLAERGVRLEQASVVTTNWGTWRRAHPETTVLVEALALGQNFDFRNDRDANGPIFPVGDVDPRLPVHEDVIGVLTASGEPVAFQRSTALIALSQGAEIAHENVRLELAAGGIRAVDLDGSDLGSHQAFWFAWSQFYPDTTLWTR